MNPINRRRLPRYNGPEHYISHQRYWYLRIRAEYPGVHLAPGVGWCGLGWQCVEQLMKRVDDGEYFGPESWDTRLPMVTS
jgi:hypothetical protein